MPGLVVFRRRWSVGSDDLVVPGAFLLTLHFICFVIVLISLIVFEYNTTVLSIKLMFYHLIGYSIVLFLSIFVEIGICIVSMRGSILDSEVRATINIWIYLKSLVILFDFTWLVLGAVWLSKFYIDAPIQDAKKVFLAIIICNWILLFVTTTTIWCVFDAAGRSWVKMKQYQRSMRETESRFNYKRSGSMNRNWRQRKVIRAYQDSWDHRCRLLFCCIGSSERNRNSFTDIARLLSDFFRELDVVPSDVVAGLVLLRKFQKVEREAVVRQRKNGTYEFLSGVPITEHTQFLALNDAKSYDFFQTVIHYMYFAQGAYGWPMYFILNRSNMWHLIPELRCFGCLSRRPDSSEVIQDNCCLCNYAALKKTLQVGDIEIVYVTYHVDVGETPFFVAIDYTQKKIVISIRGTLSMKDILTDLNAEGEVLPLTPPCEDWLGHKGMTQAAIYIKRKLEEEHLIEKALEHNTERNTHTFGLVFVGHSLGAGTAAILAILMKPEYPTLKCFSYSPPGGLLSMPAAEYSKSFITSVVLGKDVVPRIGLNQMEALRADLINAIQRSVDPKWKTISCSVICCGCGPEPTSVVEMSGKDTHINQYQEQRDTARSTSVHPADSSIALTLHQPLYPPGRIIHIVRHHPKPEESVLKTREPVYQAIWAENIDFNEVLISPVMLQDHMPDQVLAALKKVVTTSGPRKPQRQSNAFSTASNDLSQSDYEHEQLVTAMDCMATTTPHFGYDKYFPNNNITKSSYSNLSNCGVLTPTTQHKVCLETSFTNLQSPLELNSALFSNNSMSGGPNSSKASSIAGSLLGRSLLGSNSTSTAAQYDNASSILDGSSSITTVTRYSPSVPSEATTVIINEQTGEVVPLQRLKAVAFDISTSNTSVSAKSPSPQVQLKSILQRQYSARTERDQKRSHKVPTMLPLRRASDVAMANGKKLDLLHDDWLGLAPLASPETLSEISSISSRTTSAAISLANSIERYLHNMNYSPENSSVAQNNGSNNGDATERNEVHESQLHTPKIMRRAPKFTENLANCAEDNRNLEQYKRMGRVFVTFPRIFPLPGEEEQPGQLDDSSDESFESAHSLSKKQQLTGTFIQKQSSKSADQLDEENPTQPCESDVKKLTFSDSRILSDDFEQQTNASPPRGSGSVDTTFFSANSSIERFSTPGRSLNGLNNNKNSNNTHNNDAEIVLRPGVLESHFPVFENSPFELQQNVALSNSPSSSSIANKTPKSIVGGRIRKRLSSEEFIFSRNEDLSALVQLSERIRTSTPSPLPLPSPSGRKRKIYPATTTTTRVLGIESMSSSYSNTSPSKSLQQTNKTESNV